MIENVIDFTMPATWPGSVFSLSERCLPNLTIQKKKEVRGTGLKVSFSDEIIKAHRGQITIETKEE